MFSAAFSMSASSNTITGALPPSSRWVRLRSPAAAAATSNPARVEPVIDTIAGVLWLTSARPVSRSPHTTLKTTGGKKPAAISAITTLGTRVRSDGLSAGAFLQRVGELEQRPLPLARGRIAPGLEGGRGSGVGTIDVGGPRQRRRAEHLSGGRIDQVDAPAVGGGDGLAVDEVLHIDLVAHA